MLETKGLLYFIFDFNLVFQDNLTQKFIQGENLDPKNLIKSYKIDPKTYFSAKKYPQKMAHPVSQSTGVFLRDSNIKQEDQKTHMVKK